MPFLDWLWEIGICRSLPPTLIFLTCKMTWHSGGVALILFFQISTQGPRQVENRDPYYLKNVQTRDVCCPLAPVCPCLILIHSFSVGDFYRGCDVCHPSSLSLHEAQPPHLFLALPWSIFYRRNIGLWFQGLLHESFSYPQVSKLWMFASM